MAVLGETGKDSPSLGNSLPRLKSQATEWSHTIATLESANQAALDVEQASFPGFPNHAAPSLKYALWASALSTQRDLGRNGLLAQTLRPYVLGDLPKEPDKVLAILKRGDKFCCLRDAVTVLYVEYLDSQGLLEPYKTCPVDAAAWEQWRAGLYTLLAGRGFSYKTISFAGLLCWPRQCSLVPVDRHVVARLGHSQAEYHRLGKYNVYRPIELEVVAEWLSAGQPFSLGVWHWYTWEQWRQEHPYSGDKRGVKAACESHTLLSPYAY